jgi:hypothetical protein
MGTIPTWLSAIGTGELIMYLGVIGAIAAGVARLVVIHENPNKHGIGTKDVAVAMVEMADAAKKTRQLMSYILRINLWEAEQRQNGKGLPPWAKNILEEEFEGHGRRATDVDLD